MVLALCASTQGQWLKLPSAGKVDPAAPAPRGADGKPDLSGIWEPASLKFLASLDSDGIQIPFRPGSLNLFMQRQASKGKDDPDANCTFPGVPRINVVPDPFKILQSPGLTIILYEAFTTFRQIFTDGRELPEHPNPTWLGYSVGKWDGDTLVVESTGFNDRTWLDNAGHPHSESLHVTERFRRLSVGRMQIDVTINDPGAYMRPWKVTEDFRLVPGTELLEFVCSENNRDREHLVGN